MAGAVSKPPFLPRDEIDYRFFRDTTRSSLDFFRLPSNSPPYLPDAAKAGYYAQKSKDSNTESQRLYSRIASIADQMEANAIEATLYEASASAAYRALSTAELASKLLKNVDELHRMMQLERVRITSRAASKAHGLLEARTYQLLPYIKTPTKLLNSIAYVPTLWPFQERDYQDALADTVARIKDKEHDDFLRWKTVVPGSANASATFEPNGSPSVKVSAGKAAFF